jgi:uncharacterized protein (DUF302 family)
MNIIKNILLAIGALVIAGLLFAFIKLDSGALPLYANMFKVVLSTGDTSQSMIRRVKIEKDVPMEDVIASLNAIAEENNLLVVNTSLMSGGKKGGKYIRILSYCSPTIAKQFINYSMAYIAFMPCRVGIVEDDNGDIWLYTMDLGMLISGGATLPKDILGLAHQIENTMYTMIEKAAKGDF